MLKLLLFVWYMVLAFVGNKKEEKWKESCFQLKKNVYKNYSTNIHNREQLTNTVYSGVFNVYIFFLKS